MIETALNDDIKFKDDREGRATQLLSSFSSLPSRRIEKVEANIVKIKLKSHMGKRIVKKEITEIHQTESQDGDDNSARKGVYCIPMACIVLHISYTFINLIPNQHCI